VVQRLQGPRHPRRLRDPRRHGPRALLQLAIDHPDRSSNSYLSTLSAYSVIYHEFDFDMIGL
jgi:hypothetical protein